MFRTNRGRRKIADWPTLSWNEIHLGLVSTFLWQVLPLFCAQNHPVLERVEQWLFDSQVGLGRILSLWKIVWKQWKPISSCSPDIRNPCAFFPTMRYFNFEIFQLWDISTLRYLNFEIFQIRDTSSNFETLAVLDFNLYRFVSLRVSSAFNNNNAIW